MDYQINTKQTEGMADFYNAFHAVWRHRYENDLEKEGNEIKPINNNSL